MGTESQESFQYRVLCGTSLRTRWHRERWARAGTKTCYWCKAMFPNTIQTPGLRWKRKRRFLKFYFFTFTSAKKEWGLRNGNFLIVSLAALSGNAGADCILLPCDALGKDEVSWVSILFYSQVKMEKRMRLWGDGKVQRMRSNRKPLGNCAYQSSLHWHD